MAPTGGILDGCSVFDEPAHGAVLSGVDIEAMRLGTHVPRNPILLSHFSKLGLTTRIGSGIPRILQLVEKATLDLDATGFRIVLPRG
jgi:hypothetical protein